YLISTVAHVDVLCERTVWEGVLEVVRVHAGAMGNHQRVRGCCHGNHPAGLCHAAQPRDVRLDHVHAARLEQLAEPVAAVLVLASGQHYVTAAQVLPHLGTHSAECRLTLLVGMGQKWGRAAGASDRALRYQSSLSSIDKQNGHLFPPAFVKLDVFPEPLISIAGTIRTGNLGTNKPKRFCDVRPPGSAVHGQPILGLPAWSTVRGSQPHTGKMVYLYGQPLTAVIERGSEHLIPHQFHISRVLALHEPTQVFLYDIAGRLPADGDTNAYSAVIRFHLHSHTENSIDAPRLPSGCVLRVAAHGRGHRRQTAIQPMAVRHVMTVGPGIPTSSLLAQCADTFDPRETFCARH
ncbi:hypothetical protein EGW08_000053, partial [Elysia chlorotica]